MSKFERKKLERKLLTKFALNLDTEIVFVYRINFFRG